MAEDQQLAEGSILHRLEGNISWITLNRPKAGNAITSDQRPVIRDLLHSASEDRSVRAVVLAANGRHFCTGADIKGKGGSVPANRPGALSHYLQHGQECAQNLIKAFLDCDKPIVAAVQGPAVGLGMQIAIACDLIVASESSYFCEIFIQRGLLMDAGGAYLLPRRIGLQKAKELAFFGDKLSAEEALAIGMVNKVVPDAMLDEAVKDYTDRLAIAPTATIGLAKRLLNRSLDCDRETALTEEAYAAEINRHAQDIEEGISAFAQKRSPRFTGY